VPGLLVVGTALILDRARSLHLVDFCAASIASGLRGYRIDLSANGVERALRVEG
jgi:hypothetical protein